MNEYWFIHEPKPEWVKELEKKGILKGPYSTHITNVCEFYTGSFVDYIYDGGAILKTSEGIIAPINDQWIEEAKRKNPNLILHSNIDCETERIMQSIFSELGNFE